MDWRSNPHLNYTPEKLTLEVNLNETVNVFSKIHVTESSKSQSCEALVSLFGSEGPYGSPADIPPAAILTHMRVH